MEFFRRSPAQPSRLGILPGTFNPITMAHLALAGAARQFCDEILFILPRQLPHKQFSGASFEQRIAMLRTAVANEPGFSVAASDRGLFMEIAEECRQAYGHRTRLTFLCGRDAAERIAGWDYGRPGAFPEMLRQFDLLVASRDGHYHPPPELKPFVRCLTLPGEFDEVSATEIRDRAARGGAWEHLVPPQIREAVRKIYGGGFTAGPDWPPGTSRHC